MQPCREGARVRHRLTLASGILECLCFTGVVFGFASLMFVLKEEGYFSQLCVTGSNGTETSMDCSRQDEQFSLVFTIATFSNNFLVLFAGCLFDRFGTMVTRLLAIGLYTTGSLLMAFSSAALSQLLFPALVCIAGGGILLLLTNIQVGNLFPARRSTIIALYNGSFDSSSATFLIFKVLFENGISLHSSFLFLSFCSIILLLRTFLLMPRTRIPHPLPPYYTYGFKCGQANAHHAEMVERMRGVAMAAPDESSGRDNNPLAAEDGVEAQGPGKGPSFRSCLRSWIFLWHLLWLCVMVLRHYLFIGTLNPMLSRLASGDLDLVSRYTNAFAMTQLCGVLCAPWNGLIMDRHKGRPLAPGETEREADLHSCCLSLFLTSLQCLLFSVCAAVPVLPLQYFTFVVQVLNRSFLFGGSAAFISIAFPACHFGKLYGTAMSVSGVFSLLQYVCVALKGPLAANTFYVDIALTLLTLLVFIHPVHVFMHYRKEARSRRIAPTEDTGGFLTTTAKM